MSGSYVKDCSIHNSFNRAINIHDSHNILIENNVVYNTMGASIYLEDGIETGNILQYNLLVFIKSSSRYVTLNFNPS